MIYYRKQFKYSLMVQNKMLVRHNVVITNCTKFKNYEVGMILNSTTFNSIK
jgi:hypothetical protein